MLHVQVCLRHACRAQGQAANSGWRAFLRIRLPHQRLSPCVSPPQLPAAKIEVVICPCFRGIWLPDDMHTSNCFWCPYNPCRYMTAAAALGGSASEADIFGARVDKCLREVEVKAAGKVDGEKKQEQEQLNK
eukprot:1158397-Pelagomonas_calceolata.AAC.1